MLEIAFKILDAFYPPFLIVGGFESAFIALTSLDQVKSASSSILPIVHPRVILSNAWFQADGQIPVLQPQRPLPVRLKPDLSWETWLLVAALPQAFLPQALTLSCATFQRRCASFEHQHKCSRLWKRSRKQSFKLTNDGQTLKW